MHQIFLASFTILVFHQFQFALKNLTFYGSLETGSSTNPMSVRDRSSIGPSQIAVRLTFHSYPKTGIQTSAIHPNTLLLMTIENQANCKSSGSLIELRTTASNGTLPNAGIHPIEARQTSLLLNYGSKSESKGLSKMYFQKSLQVRLVVN